MKRLKKGLKKGFTSSLSRGFTLIELLVVIAIIAILATIIIINVTGARAKAAKAKVATDMSTAMKAAAACKSFGGTFTNPPAWGGDVCVTGTVSDPVGATVATAKYPVNPGSWSNPTGEPDAGITITAKDGAKLVSTIKGVGTWSVGGGGGGGGDTVAPTFAGAVTATHEGSSGDDSFYTLTWPTATDAGGLAVTPYSYSCIDSTTGYSEAGDYVATTSANIIFYQVVWDDMTCTVTAKDLAGNISAALSTASFQVQ